MGSNIISTTTDTGHIMRWNPFAPGYKQDRHAYLDELRSATEVRTMNGHRFFLDHSSVKLLLNHPSAKVFEISEMLGEKLAFSNSAEKDFSGLVRKTSKWLVHKNAQDHHFLRELLTSVWRQDEVTQSIEDYLLRLETSVPLDEPVNWIKYAQELPVYVICRILGVPEQDAVYLRHWSKTITLIQEPFASMYELAEVDRKSDELEAYLLEFTREVLQHPSTHSLPGRLCLELQKRTLNWSEADIISFLSQILIAAIETSIIFLGNAFLEASENPAAWQEVCKDPSLIPVFTEELLRLTSPLAYTGRRITDRIELESGIILAPGEDVFMCLTGANRDPLQFADPHHLKLRQPNGHIAFGYGGHYCFGSRIARFEFNSLFKLFARKGWQWEVPPQEIVYERGISFRMLKELTLVFKEL